MPLELGLFLGAKRFGRGEQKSKTCLILDVERYRYQKFISDISGQDIAAHCGEVGKANSCVLKSRSCSRTPPRQGGIELDSPSPHHPRQPPNPLPDPLVILFRERQPHGVVAGAVDEEGGAGDVGHACGYGVGDQRCGVDVVA